MQWDAVVIAISVPRPNYPWKFKAKAVGDGADAGRTVVKLRRGALRILQSTDLWIVLASHGGDVSLHAGAKGLSRPGKPPRRWWGSAPAQPNFRTRACALPS